MREGYVGGRDGFNERSATALRRQLDGMVIEKPNLDVRREREKSSCHMIDPFAQVAEIISILRLGSVPP